MAKREYLKEKNEREKRESPQEVAQNLEQTKVEDNGETDLSLSSPKPKPTVDGGELFLDVISRLRIDYVFYNSGSDYYPILEHMSEREIKGEKKPQNILCLSEQVALGMAHGYSMLAKRAQLVLVHAGIGVLQLGGAIHNAYRGRAPVLIASGRAPYTFENELLGGKDSPHHWDQELYDQAGSLREYTKWQYEVKTNSNLSHVISRAIQIANTEPQGPVYLILPRELLAETFVAQGSAKPSLRYQVPTSPTVDEESLRRIADLILESEHPIIITEYLGRNEAAVDVLVRISELLSIGVTELSRRRTNFPTTHDNYLPTFPKVDLEAADLILLLDVDVPWIPSSYKIRADAKIIQIDIDPVKSRYPLWGFPVDVSCTGSSEIALTKLLELIKRGLVSSTLLKEKIKDRAERLRLRHESIRGKLREAAAAQSNKSSGSLSIESALVILNEIKELDSIVMNESVSYTKTVENYIDSCVPSTFFSIGGSSLGDGISNALGLKLAAPTKDVVCITGDGSFIYSNPVATFCAATKHRLPILTILINNGGYVAMKRSVDKFYPGGVSKKNEHYSGVRIEPEPDYVALAQAIGAKGWRVEESAHLGSVLSNAFEETRAGKSSLVELVTGRR